MKGKITEILEKHLDVRFDYPAGYVPPVVPEAWIEGEVEAAAAIAEMVEVDKSDALKALNATWQGIADQYLSKIGRMTPLLEEPLGGGWEDDRFSAWAKQVKRVLSSAPRALWQQVSQVDQTGCIYIEGMDGDGYWLSLGEAAVERGQFVRLLALECSPRAEQEHDAEATT